MWLIYPQVFVCLVEDGVVGLYNHNGARDKQWNSDGEDLAFSLLQRSDYKHSKDFYVLLIDTDQVESGQQEEAAEKAKLLHCALLCTIG